MIVAYFAEHSPVEPTVDNNWKIVGVDLSEDDPRRAELIGYINDGLLDTPYAESYNLADYDVLVAQAQANAAAQAGNVSVDGQMSKVDAADLDGIRYYRLRDLAVSLKGTAAAFNVEWDGQVIVTKGGEYTAEALAAHAADAAVEAASIVITVDGAPVEVSVLLISGNYYVTAAGLNALLGITVETVGDVLTITTK